jgi:hypothetical protein
MSIESPICKFKKTNYKIYIAVCIVAAVWLGYDGYFNKKFAEEHKGVYIVAVRNKKLIAGENELILGAKEKIPYDSIEKIDKTNFGSKGYFIITYKDKDGGEVSRKISDKSYDNLAAILDHLVAKIT